MTADAIASITNYLAISKSIGTAGQPLPAQFKLIRQAGYQIVINLALPDSKNALPNEGELVASLGMIYIHIPVQWEKPAQADFTHFARVMDAFQGKKVFIHCALNMRVSCFLFCYRVLNNTGSEEDARKDMFSIWQPNLVWEVFMEDVLAAHTNPTEIDSV